jgi:hypothetical protein
VGQLGSSFLANLDQEQRLRYYEWWRKYLLLKRLTWAVGILYLVCWILVLGKTPFSEVARMLLKPVLFGLFGFAIWRTLMECPRCGESFQGWSRRPAAAFIGDECQNCGLSAAQLSAITKPTN